jgi:peptidoglycan/xylan/chitin deacetylase (PgdA/CDA1 family)
LRTAKGLTNLSITLCYHGVSDVLESPLAVPADLLREHMRKLADRGLRGIAFSELENLRSAGEDTSKLVGITFDDGYESTLVARDVLAEFGFTATVYILPNVIGSDQPMRWEGIEQWADGPFAGELIPMRWSGVESLIETGWEIGAHTVTHPNLTKVDDAQLKDELEASRAGVIDKLGSCESVAYPYGYADNRVGDAARAAGFANGVTLTGWFIHNDPFLRPRIGIYRHDTLRRYSVKSSSAVTRLRSLPLLLPGRSA